MKIYCLVVSSGVCFVSSVLTSTTESGERPRLSSASLFCRLKRCFVSADHCETPALPSAFMRTNNRQAIYPNTRLVEIHTDTAARSRVSMLRNAPNQIFLNPRLGNTCVSNVPHNAMMNTDATKAAHKLVNVVDATTNTTRPLRRPFNL